MSIQADIIRECKSIKYLPVTIVHSETVEDPDDLRDVILTMKDLIDVFDDTDVSHYLKVTLID